VGTHALLQPSVVFENLGLLVIDEEQRFGVAHKEKLKVASSGTDVLTLSATPIPRTLQMSLSGLRDLSLLNSPPKGRLEVVVNVCKDDDIVMRDAINMEIERGGQCFVVVPFVVDVTPVCDRLKKLIPGIRLIEAHGRHDDLEDRIDSFTRRSADVLVATTVIENGIDMPNVNTIIVLQANRFGISTLYQLRGRVGRSNRQAYAHFMTNATSLSVEAETRLLYLKSMTALGSGYELSRRDMEMRGSGTVFGTDQSGAKDVGLDLQAVILKKAVDALKTELIIGVPESKIEIGLSIETEYITQIGDMPSSEDVNALASWEANLAECIIKKYFVETCSKINIQGSSDGATSTTKSKVTKKLKPKAVTADNLMREYLAASTSMAVLNVIAEWEKRYGMVLFCITFNYCAILKK
jgi:transcription-repair coupling factor (superfamily II helicase)